MSDHQIEKNEAHIENDLIFRIGARDKPVSDKLQLLVMKLLIVLWEEEDKDDLEAMENKLSIIDDVRHELSFLRAKYYKEIFRRKMNIEF